MILVFLAAFISSPQKIWLKRAIRNKKAIAHW